MNRPVPYMTIRDLETANSLTHCSLLSFLRALGIFNNCLPSSTLLFQLTTICESINVHVIHPRPPYDDFGLNLFTWCSPPEAPIVSLDYHSTLCNTKVFSPVLHPLMIKLGYPRNLMISKHGRARGAQLNDVCPPVQNHSTFINILCKLIII